MSFRTEEKEIAAINLLEKIMDEQGDQRLGLAEIGSFFAARSILGHKERILSIIGTSGAKSNKDFRNALKQLNLEITDEFPHQETIEFLVHDVLNKFYDAVGEHYGGWEEAKKAIVLGSFGQFGLLRSQLLGLETKKKKAKARSLFRFRNRSYEDEEEDEEDAFN